MGEGELAVIFKDVVVGEWAYGWPAAARPVIELGVDVEVAHGLMCRAPDSLTGRSLAPALP